MIKYITIALLVISASSQAQTVILEENFTAGIPSTWSVFDEDDLTPAAEVTDFTSAWIGAVFGTDTAAASTSYYDPTGQANDFLVSPRVSLGNFSRILWSARSLDASYPDGYQVLISTTDSLPGSFTDTLMTVSAETAYLTTRGVELDLEGYANQDVFIAFQNNTENGYVLLIDDVRVLGAEAASITTVELNEVVTIYPNPTVDFLNINTEKNVQSISIYNAYGQVLISGKSNRIDVSELSAGMYIIHIETTEGMQISQFIKE